MGLIEKIARCKAISSDPLSFYVIGPDHRVAYTQELVEHLANVPLFSTTDGQSCGKPTYAEVEDAIFSGDMKIMGVKVAYSPFCGAGSALSDELLKKRVTATPNCVLALQTMVEANARYVELTGRPQDAMAIHPRHARELLEFFAKKS